ncbi:hypothetical protein IL306_000264 [Fusarium sp. DS 682]|nr:hypothetical protein IL306_000264 [Fusarium sp. DS 682]
MDYSTARRIQTQLAHQQAQEVTIIEDVQAANQPRLNKAYLKADPRYAPLLAPLPIGRAFSRNFLSNFQGAAEHPFKKAFLIYHPNAQACEVGARCQHWRIMDPVNLNPHPESICLKVVGVRNDFVAAGNSGFDGVKMFDYEEDQQHKICAPPRFIFEAMKPDFSVIEQAGYAVAYWSLIDLSPNAEIKWMDQYGRSL